MRKGPVVLFVSAAMLLASASLAWAVGELTQKPGAAGCIGKVGGKAPCQQALGFGIGTSALAISPDGRNVYVGSEEGSNGSLEVFDRDPAGGALTQKPGKSGCFSREGGGCEVASDFENPHGIVVSPDGKNVYVASQGGLAGGLVVFDRDQSGALVQKPGAAGCFDESGRAGCTKVAALNSGAVAVAVSPDGKNVYVATGLKSALVVFDRDTEGRLTPQSGKAGCFGGAGCETARALHFPTGVTVSPDGKSVYVASREADAVAVFDRDSEGRLTQEAGPAGCIATTIAEGCTQGRALGKAEQIVVTPDGSEVLVAAQGAPERGFEGGIAIFDRDQSGALTQKQGPAGCITKDGSAGACQAGTEVQSADAIALDGDGGSLYVAGGRGVGIFDRQPGGLWAEKQEPVGCLSTSGSGGNCQASADLGFPAAVAVSPGDDNVYTTSESGVAIFDRAGSAAPPPPETKRTPPDTTAPALSGFRLAPSRFIAAPRGKGSRFRLTLSEPAGVAIEIQRVVPGRRVGKACQPARPGLTRGRPCARFLKAGTLANAGLGAGADSIAFSGKVGKRALRPGSYRATIVATDAAGNRSAPSSAAFTVLAAAR